MPNAGRWQAESKKIKNRCIDVAHHGEAHHFLMNGRRSLSACPAFANVTLCKAICRRWQRSRHSHRPRRYLQILFIICCHMPKQGRQEWQVGVQQKKRERTKRHDMSHFQTTWVLNSFSFIFYFFEDTCQLGSLIHWELLIQPSKLGVFWLQLQLLILLSVAHMIFSLLFFPLW